MYEGVVFREVALATATATATPGFLPALSSDVPHLQAALPSLLHYDLVIALDFLFFHDKLLFFPMFILCFLERLNFIFIA